MVLVVGQDLFFLPRIQSAANALGYEIRQTRTGSDFWDAYQERQPALVLVDLEGDQDTWPKVVQGLRQRPDGDTRIVAFGPHADVAGMERARELGCDVVLTKDEFVRGLPKIFEA